MPGHDPDNPIRIFRDPSSPHGWRAQADELIPGRHNPRHGAAVDSRIKSFKPGPTALENPIYDRSRTPRPPNERGWVSDPIDAIRRLADLSFAVRFRRSLDAALHELDQRRATDATFENETRPHR
jgi:hypothetical protein